MDNDVHFVLSARVQIIICVYINVNVFVLIYSFVNVNMTSTSLKTMFNGCIMMCSFILYYHLVLLFFIS